MTTQQTRPPSSAAIAQTIVETKTDTTEIIKLLTAAGDGEEDRIDQILKALATLLELVTAIRDDVGRLASAVGATQPR